MTAFVESCAKTVTGSAEAVARRSHRHPKVRQLIRLLADKKRILITTTDYAENTDMGWKSVEKNSVGKDWGKAPSLVEGIRATITLPIGDGVVGRALEKGAEIGPRRYERDVHRVDLAAVDQLKADVTWR